MQKTKWEDSGKNYYLKGKNVLIGRQAYQTVFLPFLIKEFIFGKGYSTIKERKLIKNEKEAILLYIAFTRKTNEIFTINQECGVSFV